MRLNNFLRNIFAIPLLSFALTICLCAQGSQPRGAGSTDERQIKQVLARYAESIDEADVRLASKVWLNSPAVSFIHPQGDEQGFAQIEHNFYQSLMRDTFSERHLKPRDVAIHVYGRSAWVEFFWDFDAKVRKDGSSISTHGRETQVYWKMKTGWRLVHVHYSGMPA
jgi:ketosteroid isomerase-like protein